MEEEETGHRWHLVWWSVLCLAVMWMTAQQTLMHSSPQSEPSSYAFVWK